MYSLFVFAISFLKSTVLLNIQELNLGSTVDGNVVFSQESYVPRSAMVNLTVSLFGENLNLFEVGARAEGFETMIEDFFGPEGYFR